MAKGAPQGTSLLAFFKQNQLALALGLVSAFCMGSSFYLRMCAPLIYATPLPLFLLAVRRCEEAFWVGSATAFCALFAFTFPAHILFFAALSFVPAYMLLKAFNQKKKGATFLSTHPLGKEWRTFEIRLGYMWITFLCALTMLIIHFLPPASVALKFCPPWMLKNPTFKNALPTAWAFVPAFFSLSWGSILWANLALTKYVCHLTKTPHGLIFRTWYVPPLFYGIFVGLLMASSIWTGSERLVWLNFLVVLSVSFFLEGCVVLRQALSYAGLERAMKPLMFLSILAVFPLLIITLLGVIEPLTLLKQRLKRS